MIRAGFLVCVGVLAALSLRAQSGADLELARALSDPAAREQAVASLVAAGAARVPLLLRWTASPPDNVDAYELKIGLADAFGALRLREAVPFLVKNISIDRSGLGNTWLKSPEAVEGRLAAAAALIRIGPDAVPAIFLASARPTTPKDRLATIFVISRMADFPGKRNFLLVAAGQANLERAWAETGLSQFDSPRPKP
jgi:hypothetical protein